MMSNPVEEFLLEKTALDAAAVKGMAGQAGATMGRALNSPFARAAGAGALTGAGAAAFAGLVGASRKMYDASTKVRDFRRMLEANPDLVEHHEADPAGFNRLFTSLRTFAPDFTRDPLVAGAYMRRGMESLPEARGGVAVTAMNDMGRGSGRTGPASEAALQGYMKGMSIR